MKFPQCKMGGSKWLKSKQITIPVPFRGNFWAGGAPQGQGPVPFA